MIGRLLLPLALATSFAGAAAAQDPFWAGASRLKCTIETAATCNGLTCTPMNVARTVFVERGASQVCASNDGATCAFRYYPVTQSDQAGRLLLVVRGTGTSYSIGRDGRMAGGSVVSPQAHVFIGHCVVG